MVAVIFKAEMAVVSALIKLVCGITDEIQLTDYQRIGVGVNNVVVKHLGSKGRNVARLSVARLANALFLFKPEADL